jgi:tRNA threonylcarbamoyladenosine biosynthesis protein TsaE
MSKNKISGELRGELTYSLDELDSVVEVVYPLFKKTSVTTLTGSLGAGKTTLVQALLAKAGVAGPIQSPTYAYLNTYDAQLVPKIFHFDLYRLSSLDEFFMAGFDEYLYQSDTKTLIEWPEIVMPILQRDVCHITIDYQGLDKRKITYRTITK